MKAIKDHMKEQAATKMGMGTSEVGDRVAGYVSKGI
jgi:hypothetical protein